jgi:hypothetical protein
MKKQNLCKKKEFIVKEITLHGSGDTTEDFYSRECSKSKAKEILSFSLKEGGIVYEYDKKKGKHRQIMHNWGEDKPITEVGSWYKGKP